jgi:hypothetical protein
MAVAMEIGTFFETLDGIMASSMCYDLLAGAAAASAPNGCVVAQVAAQKILAPAAKDRETFCAVSRLIRSQKRQAARRRSNRSESD